MNLIWRFYRDEDRLWKWQKLSASREVILDSPKGHKDYEGCLADATKEGYKFVPPKGKRIQEVEKHKW